MRLVVRKSYNQSDDSRKISQRRNGEGKYMLCLALFDKFYMLYLILAPFIYFAPIVWIVNVNIVVVLAFLVLLFGVLSLVPFKFYTRDRMLFSISSLSIIGMIIWYVFIYDFHSVMTESYHICVFLVSVLVFSKPNHLRNPLRYLKLFGWIGGIAGVVSLSLRLGLIIGPDIVASKFYISNRSGVVVDSVCSIVGLTSILLLLMYDLTKNKYMYSILFGFCLINIILSGYRTYIIMAVIIILVLAFSSKLVPKLRLIYSIMLLAVFSMIIKPSFFDDTFIRFSSFASADMLSSDDSIQWRIAELYKEIMLIKEKPILGNGWGMSEREVVSRPGMGEMNMYGHNQYTGLAARTGLPVALFFWSLWISWLIKSIGMWWKIKFKNDAIYIGGSAIIFSFLAGGFTQNLMTMTLSAPALAVFISPIICRPVSMASQKITPLLNQ